MQIKRNIAKSHVVSKNKTNKVTTPLVRRNVNVNQTGNEPPKLKSSGLGQYKYPVCGTVPEGYYITRIIDACQKNTVEGEMIDVFYLLEPARQCYNRINKLVPEGTKSDRYHIKQTYPVGSSFYEDFVSEMECALGVAPGTEIILTDIIGVEEYVKLEYTDYSPIGGFSARCPIFFEDIYDEKLHVKEESTCVSEVEEVSDNTTKNENVDSEEDDIVDEAQSADSEEGDNSCEVCESDCNDYDEDDEFDDYDDEFDDFMDDIE